MKINNLVVLGSGLIGASLAKAARTRKLTANVAVVNRRSETNEAAINNGVADIGYTYDQLATLLAGLSSGDIVVAAVPVKAYAEVFGLIADQLPDGVVLTDVGSTKVEVIYAAKAQWGKQPGFFVPAHPIAGSERSGVEAANETLFTSRRTIITPLECNNEEAVNRVRRLWEAIGAEVDVMEPRHHDEILAATSHLPHLLAYGLVDSLYTLDQKTEVFRYAAGGFRDFTRIAESDPVMWRDVFLANKGSLIKQLENFEAHLAELHKAIETGDSETIETILERAQNARKLYRETNQ